MEIINHVSELQAIIRDKIQHGLKVGLVPTMGALHQGHLSLLRKAREENDISVVSIFVNPTQFNDQTDLKNYPRTPEADYALLKKEGCDLVFAPTVEEMYPSDYTFTYTIGNLAEIMEGKFRPGHFQGVVLVVNRLFRIVTPHRAYFGEKDYQQMTIIRKMVQDLKIPVEIRPCPIIREPDGLAMSSRNVRLGKPERENAPFIAQTLLKAASMGREKSPSDIENYVIRTIDTNPYLKTEYFNIVDALTLTPLKAWDKTRDAIGCIAVWAGKIRLIDNVKFLS